MLSLSSSVGSMVDGIVIGQFLGVDSIAAFGIINPSSAQWSLQVHETGSQAFSVPAKRSRPVRYSLLPALCPQGSPPH